MRKFKLIVEYEGTAYHGWQCQPNGVTIQEVLQDTLGRITKKKTVVVSSSRTDSGVHAEAHPGHFVTDSRMTEIQFLKALNSLLPRDIVVKEVNEVPMEFNAQKSAKRKIYRYTILNRDFPSALQHRRCWFIQTPLDVEAMQDGARHLVGMHDFSAFRAANCENKNPVRELYRIEIGKQDHFIHMRFEGNGFLKHMVRNIVGTLVQVGKGKMESSQMTGILKSLDRNQAGPTAPSHGLCLVNVIYDADE